MGLRDVVYRDLVYSEPIYHHWACKKDSGQKPYSRLGKYMLLPPVLTKQSFYPKISIASRGAFARPRSNQEARTDSSLADAIHPAFEPVLWLREQGLIQVPGTMDLRRGHPGPPPSSWAFSAARKYRYRKDSLCFPNPTCWRCRRG